MNSPGPDSSFSPRPGLQGHLHGHIRITIYRREAGSLNFLASSLGLSGRNAADDTPTVVNCAVQQSMGQPSSFQIGLKMPPGESLLDACSDDDWVDIESGTEGKWHHIMRGLVDEVRESTDVSGGGATVRNGLIAGQGFQKIWAQTPMWFSSIFAENLSLGSGQGSVADIALSGIGRNVPGTIANFLYSYTGRVAQSGRSSVAMPPNMPGVDKDFANSWRMDATGFDDRDAPRQNLLVNSFAPAQSVWDVAQSWSDPYFVEMFTAILPRVSSDVAPWSSAGDALPQLINADSAMAALGEKYEGTQDGLSVRDSALTVVVRNKPFVNVDKENSALLGFSSPWFSLPTLEVTPQALTALDIGRNGYERTNAFFMASQVLSAIGEAPTSAKTLPTWSVEDMRVHGLRSLDVVSNYIPRPIPGAPGLDGLSQAIRLRARARDHNCYNAEHLNGTVTFGRAYPEVQIGTRLRIVGRQTGENFTAYIESVSQRWSAPGGWKTSLGVTRGYYGSDRDYIAAIQRVRSTYSEPVA